MDALQLKVSVVIPCYNSRAFVPTAVESVLAQTVAVHEVIVIDDGSTDDPSAALSALHDPRLKIVRTENSGVSRARNLGGELATGDIVGFLDADDVWYPTKLERQLELFASEPRPVAVGAQMHHIGARGAPVGITGVDELDHDAQESVRTAYLMPFAISSAIVDRNAFTSVGGFDEKLQRDVPGQVEDLDFMSRVAAQGPIRTVGAPLGGYRVHPGSISARQYRSQRQGARFVHARALARDAGHQLTWPEFLAGRTHRQREWFDDTARSLYRAAGVLAADGHYAGAAWRFGTSLVLRPSYAIRRLRQQRVMAHLRAARAGSENANTS